MRQQIIEFFEQVIPDLDCLHASESVEDYLAEAYRAAVLRFEESDLLDEVYGEFERMYYV